jgi:hypothetical protein
VNSTFRTLGKRLDAVRKKINSKASKRMKAEEYDAARKWMDIGQMVGEFSARVDVFATEWEHLLDSARAAVGEGSGGDSERPGKRSSKRTPSWKFRGPALKALLNRGGSASHSDIISDLKDSMASGLTETDQAVITARGIPLWHDAVHRVYRQCQREGWIEKRRDDVWKLTAKGGSSLANE